MNMFNKGSMLAALSVFVLMTSPASLKAYYQVGESLTQATLDRVVDYCANGGADEAFSELLVPQQGQATRVLLVNFFSSW